MEEKLNRKKIRMEGSGMKRERWKDVKSRKVGCISAHESIQGARSHKEKPGVIDAPQTKFKSLCVRKRVKLFSF